MFWIPLWQGFEYAAEANLKSSAAPRTLEHFQENNLFLVCDCIISISVLLLLKLVCTSVYLSIQ